MVYIIIGTKAQLVKVAPLMLLFQQENIDYKFILTGQHKNTVETIRKNFRIKEPDLLLYDGEDIVSIFSMIRWFFFILCKGFFKRKAIFEKNKNSIVLVHGDTLSCLAGALMGKIARIRVGHIESGLRSYNLFHPFPEEITRLLTFALTNVYYCPGKWAMNNVKKYRGTKINTVYNTIFDSLHEAKSNFDTIDISIPQEKYAIVSSHRFENIYNKEVLTHNLNLIKEVSKNIKVLFILHPVTEKRLLKYDLLTSLQDSKNIELRDRYDYFRFMKLLYYSEFIVTDGGSNQEECYYMGKPCLLLRKTSERMEGLDKNTVISEYDLDKTKDFVKNYTSYSLNFSENDVSPVRIILHHLQESGIVQ